jgi:tRNA dimethylallyltransferase
VDPDEPFTVADFRAHALGALRGLGARGGIGILAGGTGFWLRAVANGIDTDELPHDPRVRADAEAEVARDGLDAAAARLRTLAPRLAARTDLRNPRRIVRALEIATLRGDAPLPVPLGYPAAMLGLQLTVDDPTLRARIRSRARRQFEAGLLDEARALRERWDPSLPCFSAIGYHESWAHLDGELSLDEAMALDALHNEQFAKRQRTWFRREPMLDRLEATDPLPVAIARLDAWLDGIGGAGWARPVDR